MTTSRVLVTGGSGFLAGHIIRQLLDQGHDVRATARDPRRAPRLGATEFVRADLTADDGWAEAVADRDYVLHVASPVRPGPVADENDLIVPAREGTLRVLRAARDAGVKRVVLTSAFHAVGWGHPRTGHTFTEDDWTVLDGPGVDAYGRSKTLAERAAWDLLDGSATELTTILPVAVMGPLTGDSVSGANHVVQRLLTGQMPGLLNLWFPIVDVRDVAAAHLLAMTGPEAAGQRFLAAGGPAMSMSEIAAVLRDNLGDAAAKVPANVIPDSLVTPPLPDLGLVRKVSGEKARRVLGWQARPAGEAILAAASSLIDRGLV
ncbi:aldehyde reductase [Actinoplanes sp. NPDC051861]|uniref:SDR family oxidoreductase n=1 Tax=Actinoplanes sp. NPDC051861 TaxID=3155170 RepID=UPI003448A5AF